MLRITVTPTTDYEAVLDICRHPGVYPYIRDDGAPEDPADFQVPESRMAQDIWFLIHVDEGDGPKVAGWFHVEPRGGNVGEYHGGYLPEFRKRLHRQLGLAVIRAYWRYLPFNVIVSMTPDHNRGAHKFNTDFGLKRTGTVPRAFKLHGTEHDIAVYTAYRADWLARFGTGDKE